MAKTLDQVGIETGNTVEAYHVTQSIDAFTGVVAYDISLSGSFNMTGSINGEPLVINPLTASYAITASYSENALSASYAVSASYEIIKEVSSSHADFADTASYVENAQTASYVENAQTASYVENAQTSSKSIVYRGTDSTVYLYSGQTGTTPGVARRVETYDTLTYDTLSETLNVTSSYSLTSSVLFDDTGNGISIGSDTGVVVGNGGGTPNPPAGNQTNFTSGGNLRLQIDDSGSVNLGDGTQGTLSNLLNGKISTSGSESSTLLTLPSSTGVAYTVQAYIVGYGGANGKIGGDVMGVFQNVGGTLTSAGTVIQNKIEDFTGAPDFTLTTSGTDIILQVTGQAATSINWAGHLKFVSYDSTL